MRYNFTLMDATDTRRSAPIELIYFLLILMACLVVASLAANGIAQLMGIPDLPGLIESAGRDMLPHERQALLAVLGINQGFTFLLPSVLFVLAFHAARPLRFLHLDRGPSGQQAFWALLMTLAAFPIAQLLLKLNQLIPIGNQAAAMEARAARLTEALLQMDGLPALLGTLLVVAVLPAIGEELVFRGILQRYLDRYGAHLAIWSAALLFSAFHMQFAGFLPRLFLGALMGYLLHWSGSLWLPIFAHLLNNGAQILAVYVAQQRGALDDLLSEATPTLPWWGFAMAIAVFAAAAYRLRRTAMAGTDTRTPTI